jgi:hypothetical protein
MIILFAILVGFSVAFRLLFRETGDASFGSLRRSFLNTFEMTIVGSYDPLLLFEAKYSVLAVLTFILAVTCVLVVALNALIFILADSYPRVQEDATANRRKEQCSLIVEYMSLLPPWKRKQIERDTRWFHTLLEVDADGDLLVNKDNWEGGLNALRRNIRDISQHDREIHHKHLQEVKADLDSKLAVFKNKVISLLEELSSDIKQLQTTQSTGGMSFSGAVKSIGRKGSSVFGKKDAK